MDIPTMTMRLILAAALAATMILAAVAPLHAQFDFDECSNSTAWVPPGLALPGRALHAVTLDDTLYIFHMISPEADSPSVALSKWDGANLIRVSTFVADGSINQAIAYNGHLYISGAFPSVDDIPGTRGLARWDGSAWSQVPGNNLANDQIPAMDPSMIPYSEQMFKMTIYKGELVVSGWFTGPAKSNGGIYAWNGTSWRPILRADRHAGDSVWITSMTEWRGDLYVAGYFYNLGEVPNMYIARWNGSEWSGVGEGFIMRGASALIVYEDRLYAIGGHVFSMANVIARWDGAVWEYPPHPRLRMESWYLSAVAAVHEGDLYMMMSSSPSAPVAMRFDGSNVEMIARPNLASSLLVGHRGELYAGGRFTGSCGVNLGYFARLCTPLTCFGVAGRVLEDDGSGDCSETRPRKGLPGRIVELLPGPSYAVTDHNGEYRIYTAPGTYSLGLLPHLYWNQICPPGMNRWEFPATAPGESIARDFVAAAEPEKHDLAVSLAGGRLRSGFPFTYALRCSNVGTTMAYDVPLRFEYDARLGMPDSVYPAPVRTGEGWVEWRISALPRGSSSNFTIKFEALPRIGVGEEICASAVVVMANEISPADNHEKFCGHVVNSYDPNDMAVFPAGPENNGHISMADTMLTYTVRFQNTGTDTAFRVVVIDTISPNLDLASLRLGASSHPFTLKIRNGGALIFIFDDIALPHQKINDDGSQGFFRFSIGLKSRTLPNTQIPNRAQIYFDYNDPITTNTVVSTVVETPVSSVDSDAKAQGVKVFPNPAHGAVYLRGAIVPGSTVELRNMLGELVMSWRYERPGDAEIDLENLPAGRYLLNVQTPAGREAHAITLVR